MDKIKSPNKGVNYKEEFKNLLLMSKKGEDSPYPRIQSSIDRIKEKIKAIEGTTNSNIEDKHIENFLSLFLDNFDDMFLQFKEDDEGNQSDKLLISEQEFDKKIQEEFSNITDEKKKEEIKSEFKKIYIRILEILAVFRKQERLKTSSHRGFEFGEQLSFDAISNALKQGVKNIELDIITTADGELVVSHDGKTKINGKFEKVSKLNWSEIENGKGTIDRTSQPMYKIDTLFDFFKDYHGMSKLNIEIKEKNTALVLIKYLEKHPEVIKNIIISAFDPIALLEIHEKFPNIPIGYNTFVTKANIDSLLKTDFKEKKPFWKKDAIIGGNTIPEEVESGLVQFAHHTNLPIEIREMIKKSKGYLGAITIGFLVNNVGATHKVKFEIPTLYSAKKWESLKEDANKLGIKLFIPDPQDAEIKKHSSVIDNFIVSKKDLLTYPRLGRESPSV